MREAMEHGEEKIRLDKWLWAARFFKTRSLASQAVAGGRVHVNGQRVKPARTAQVGDELRISRSETTFVVTIVALSGYRRPATEARLLYTESPESIREREEQSEMRRLVRAGQAAPSTRPGKRDRRKILEFTKKNA